MAKLIITDKMLEMIWSADGKTIGEVMLTLIAFHMKEPGDTFERDEEAIEEGPEAVRILWKLVKAEYLKNKSHAEVARKSRKAASEQVTVTSQLLQEKETPNEKESPSPAPLPKEKENTKEKELFAQTEFERWWEVYPRKVSKKKSREVFRLKSRNLSPGKIKALVDLLIAETKAQGLKYGWTKDREQYIPHPSTWLFQERYMDAVSKEHFVPFSQNNKSTAKRPANYLPSEGGTDGAF